MWEDLAEVRSLAFREGQMGRGIVTKLVEACISEAIVLGIPRSSRSPTGRDFFRRLGFREVDKSELPHKIWSDCSSAQVPRLRRGGAGGRFLRSARVG
jgi:amino-acid N-acetyltransferase